MSAPPRRAPDAEGPSPSPPPPPPPSLAAAAAEIPAGGSEFFSSPVPAERLPLDDFLLSPRAARICVF